MALVNPFDIILIVAFLKFVAGVVLDRHCAG
jgi:hypothetical protein